MTASACGRMVALLLLLCHICVIAAFPRSETLQKASRGRLNYHNDEKGFMEPLDIELARKQLEIIARDLAHDHDLQQLHPSNRIAPFAGIKSDEEDVARRSDASGVPYDLWYHGFPFADKTARRR